MSNPILITLKIYLEQFCCDFFSKKQIDSIFSGGGFTRDESIKFEYKRDLINQYYKSVDWESPVIIPKLNQVIETILYFIHLSDDAKNNFRKTLSDIGFKFDGNKVIYQPIIPNNSLFLSQFPVGLPFGKPKPEFAVQINKGSQKLKFEWKNGIGIIDFNVYPDLTYQKLAQNFNLYLGTTDKSLRIALRDMNQTEYETQLFLHYANKFNMANQNIPILIPQAWIQWHSQSKKYLNSTSSLNINDIYRVDFVAFWKNKRFAIFIDDISHYATRKYNQETWLASEEEYSKNIQQDRKLMKEGWFVIRFSNWEIKQKELLDKAMINLQEIIVFS
ncbi:MAG: very short patch repair endonuclease [Nostoc desertorum CM1-VF14]|jgi:very-short-patch-repair endonuclease|nr:very short patch repair endonuclease [Nostoc desertorum CM1-VF14]